MASITLQGMLGGADNVTATFLSQTYPALARAVELPLYYAAIIYWVLLGYKVYAGHAPFSWKDFLAKTVMTVGVLGTLRWNGLAKQIYDIFVTSMESAGSIPIGMRWGKQRKRLDEQVKPLVRMQPADRQQPLAAVYR